MSQLRAAAARALHNLARSQPDGRRARREARVLRLLEQLREFTESLWQLADERGQPALVDGEGTGGGTRRDGEGWRGMQRDGERWGGTGRDAERRSGTGRDGYSIDGVVSRVRGSGWVILSPLNFLYLSPGKRE